MIFELTKADFAPMAQFPLAWRWTDPGRITPMEVSADAIAEIAPLTPEAATRAHAHAAYLLRPPKRTAFTEVADFDVGRIGRQSLAAEAEVRTWLTQHLGDETGRLVISWSAAWAATTTVANFIALWPTFCYPVEDIVIWPTHERWLLLFDYKQRFYLERMLG